MSDVLYLTEDHLSYVAVLETKEIPKPWVSIYFKQGNFYFYPDKTTSSALRKLADELDRFNEEVVA
jgi:hypothetical protein